MSVNAGSNLPAVGEVVGGKYRIERIIGAGGMGVVLGATDISLGRPVALKLLAQSQEHKPDALPRFEREARAAASLETEHVAKVLDVGVLENGARFIAMEWLRGQDLGHALAAQGQLPLVVAADHLLEACVALAEAHARGIVHRDLKPQNLFVVERPDGSPMVKVLDFGISKMDTEGDAKLTSTDMAMGTPLYMSPEQVRSLKHVDQRADVWAMGAILFELLAGRPVWAAPSASAVCAAIIADAPSQVRVFRPDVPVAIDDIIARSLQKNPDARFQSIAEFAAALAPYSSARGQIASGRACAVEQRSSGKSLYPATLQSNPGALAPTLMATQRAEARKSPGAAVAVVVVAALAIAGIVAAVVHFRPHGPGPTAQVGSTSASSRPADTAMPVDSSGTLGASFAAFDAGASAALDAGKVVSRGPVVAHKDAGAPTAKDAGAESIQGRKNMCLSFDSVMKMDADPNMHVAPSTRQGRCSHAWGAVCVSNPKPLLTCEIGLCQRACACLQQFDEHHICAFELSRLDAR